jgi:hypothetical protein
MAREDVKCHIPREDQRSRILKGIIKTEYSGEKIK